MGKHTKAANLRIHRQAERDVLRKHGLAWRRPDPQSTRTPDGNKSIDVACEAVRKRVANSGPPWTPPSVES